MTLLLLTALALSAPRDLPWTLETVREGQVKTLHGSGPACTRLSDAWQCGFDGFVDADTHALVAEVTCYLGDYKRGFLMRTYSSGHQAVLDGNFDDTLFKLTTTRAAPTPP